MKMSRHHTLCFKMLVLLSLLVVIVTACKRSAGTTESPHQLKVGYIPIAECLPLYIAEEQGFFEKHNLDVQLINFQGGAYVLTALTNGDVDVGFSNVVSLVLHASEGAEFVSVYGATYETPRNQNHAIAVRGNLEGGASADFFRGKVIAVNTHRNIEALMLEKYLRSLGLLPTEYEVVAHGFPQMLPLIETRQIDGACLVEPFVTTAHESSNSTVRVVANQYLATSDRTVVATYVSSTKALARHPEAIAAFTAAMAEATAFIKSNEGRSRAALARYTKIPEERVMTIGLSEFSDSLETADLTALISDMKQLGYLAGKPAPPADSLIKVRGSWR